MRVRVIAFVGAVLMMTGYLAPARAAGSLPTIIRVGVVAYDNFQSTADRYRAYLGEVSRGARTEQLTFRLAVGTYSEVLDWYKNESIDVGIFTPGPVAQLLSNTADQPKVLQAYLGTRTLAPASVSPYSEPDRTVRGQRYDYYHAAVIVHADSKIRTLADLVGAARARRLRFLLNHPLSVSSYIYPSYYLKKQDIILANGPLELTYSHEVTVNRIANATQSERDSLIGFVYDGMDVSNVKDALTRIRKLELPDYSSRKLPQDVALTNIHSPVFTRLGDILRPLFLATKTDDVQFADHATATDFGNGGPWYEAYGEVIAWLRAAQISAADERTAKMTFKEVARQITSNATSGGDQPRLALVLSGGGAKCAYQAGVIGAIEPTLGGDLKLVVGTSGGALNALAVALGVTKNRKGSDLLQSLWRGIGQRDFIIPWSKSGFTFGMFAGLLVATLVVLAIRRPSAAAGSLIGFGLGGFVLAFARVDITTVLPASNHWIAHGAVVVVLASLWGCYWLPAVGGLVWWSRGRVSRTRQVFILTFSSVLAGVAFAFLTLGFNESIAQSQGVEHAVAHAVPQLLRIRLEAPLPAGTDIEQMRSALRDIERRHDAFDRSLLRRLHAPFVPEDEYSRELHELSVLILQNHLLVRDLVITGSKLTAHVEGGPVNKMPGDLYFYAPAALPESPAPADRRFLRLGEEATPERDLLDVVVGSASIFPLFPGRALRPDANYALVDGGFAHNIPVEAAVRWNASQVLVIEASPEDSGPTRGLTFMSNAFAAFNLLFAEAQQTDMTSKGSVPLFEIRPTGAKCKGSPGLTELDLFDFTDDLATRSIQLGAAEADCDQPTYRRVWLTNPSFMDVKTRE
jgi:predicted acylesterase/phospholipase RssA/ABC-type phosphate/phosphonate transport system substrate-binding protein